MGLEVGAAIILGIGIAGMAGIAAAGVVTVIGDVVEADANDAKIVKAIKDLDSQDEKLVRAIANVWEGGTVGEKTHAMADADAILAAAKALVEGVGGEREQERAKYAKETADIDTLYALATTGAGGTAEQKANLDAVYNKAKNIDDPAAAKALNDLYDLAVARIEKKQADLDALYPLAVAAAAKKLTDLEAAKTIATNDISKKKQDLEDMRDTIEVPEFIRLQAVLDQQLTDTIADLDRQIADLAANQAQEIADATRHLLNLVETKDQTLAGLVARGIAGDVEAARRVLQIQQTTDQNKQAISDKAILDMNETADANIFEIGSAMLRGAQATGEVKAKIAASGVKTAGSPLMAMLDAERENTAAIADVARRGNYRMASQQQAAAQGILSQTTSGQQQVADVAAANLLFDQELSDESARVTLRFNQDYANVESSIVTINTQSLQKLQAFQAQKASAGNLHIAQEGELASRAAESLMRYTQDQATLDRQLIDFETVHVSTQATLEAEAAAVVADHLRITADITGERVLIDTQHGIDEADIARLAADRDLSYDIATREITGRNATLLTTRDINKATLLAAHETAGKGLDDKISGLQLEHNLFDAASLANALYNAGEFAAGRSDITRGKKALEAARITGRAMEGLNIAGDILTTTGSLLTAGTGVLGRLPARRDQEQV